MLCPHLLPTISGGEGDGETAALETASASYRANTAAKLSAWAPEAPWPLSLLGRLLWREAAGEGRHHAMSMHHTLQSKTIETDRK